MLARVGADELAEWQALYRIDPWGEGRADLRSAMICFILYQANRGKDSPDRKLTDFLPSFGEDESERKTPEELKAALLGLTAAVGGTIDG